MADVNEADSSLAEVESDAVTVGLEALYGALGVGHLYMGTKGVAGTLRFPVSQFSLKFMNCAESRSIMLHRSEVASVEGIFP